jgi:hypothetical protein
MPNKEKLSAIFLSIMALVITIQAIAATALFLLPAPAQAQANKSFSMNLAVPLPSLNNGNASIKFTGDTEPIAAYIKAIYNFAVGAVGIVAAVVLMIGGVMWITAGGNASTVGEAKSMITASLTGLVLVLTSYLLLSQVNPALVNLSSDINGINVPVLTQTPSGEENSLGCDWVEGRENLRSTGCLPSDNSKCTNPKPDGLSNAGCCCKYKPITDDCSWSVNKCADGYDQIDPGKYTDNNLRTCGTDTGDGSLSYCCCKTLEWSNWNFDPGIRDQLKQADPSLRTLLSCMRQKMLMFVSRNKGRITSISDKSVVYPNTMDVCTANWSQPPCAHAKGSCHYNCGGAKAGFSCAADFGIEDAAALTEAANECDPNAFVLPETNPPHIHISTSFCPHN